MHTLRKRANWLRARISQGSAAKLSYDVEELAALEWAISVLTVWLEQQQVQA